METTITKQEGCIVVVIEGRVDTTTAKDLETKVAEILKEESSNIVIDCEKMSYISSSGLRAFLLLQKGINKKQGKLMLRSMNNQIKEIFEITGLASIFTIE